MANKRLNQYLLALLLIPLLGSTAPNCLGLSKRDGAVLDGTSGTDFLTTCPSANSYLTHAEPIFQSFCVSCHVSGGAAGSPFVLFAGSGLSTDKLNSNYGSALRELLANDNGTLTDNPILSRPLGNNSHTTVFASQADSNYASLYQWVSDERAAPCP